LRSYGLLLLKGFSHREIAELRETSERTVREQARALYRKASLKGRASLSAYFLEDLLVPLP
jgi:DNA-binding NarL/FixJ family response regulator